MIFVLKKIKNQLQKSAQMKYFINLDTADTLRTLIASDYVSEFNKKIKKFSDKVDNPEKKFLIFERQT